MPAINTTAVRAGGVRLVVAAMLLVSVSAVAVRPSIAAPRQQPVAQAAAAPVDTVPVPPDSARADTLAQPVVVMRERFEYSAGGRRDPFLSLLSSQDLRPMVSDLRVTGIGYDPGGQSMATVRDVTTSQTRAVRVGSQLGRLRVIDIRPNVVVFSIEEFGLNRRDSIFLRDTSTGRPPR
jgi:hypothetical protein